jgi:nitrite reductase/ring-hydroxylating ferredoxin subunit/DMSO/TMAO reductase YedYZ heme-binding membrane subunit
MSAGYRPVGWNRAKLVYDGVLAAAVIVYLTVFLQLAPAFQGVTLPVDGAVLRMQAFGTCAFLMLTVALSIGPLARLDRRLLPLLYNRRHLGVATAVVAAIHASHVLGWYYAFSPTDPYVALLSANTSYGQLLGFPFEALGLAALLILAVLAATSHDFWLAFLTPPIWKAIHFGIYAAYALVVAHIGLGALQGDDGPLMGIVAALSVAAVVGLHLAAAAKRRQAIDTEAATTAATGWVVVPGADALAAGRAITVRFADGTAAAVFRDGDRLAAVSNVCAHQNGPLGEGRILDGCVTCPWHGYQYRLLDGRAPPPFTERIATYNLKREAGRVLIDPRPNPPGTPTEGIDVPPDGAERLEAPRLGEATT